MRRKLIAGNWKMNKTPNEALTLIAELKSAVAGADADVCYCVPSIDIIPAVEAVKGTTVEIGAQNLYYEEKGAYTGEISAAMLTDAGVKYVIIGHSERRGYFHETDEDINKKLKKAIEHGLTPILCCGESLEQREAGDTFTWVESQIEADFDGISASDAVKTVIAYEPIWAIGTGRTATSAQAEEVCAHIRTHIAKLYDQATADAIRILYGGSMNADNAAELLSQPDIDGGLIGGASLKADFAKIVHCGK